VASKAEQPQVERLRFTGRSIALAIGAVGLTIFLLRMLADSTRVLGWVAVAAIGAGLLHPLVTRLATRIPRGLALAAVFLGTLASVGGLGYLGIDDIRQQTDRLEETAPEAAAELEESDRFGEAAREFELREKVESFVDDLPNRLRGGETPEALRAAATRGVAFLATAVLTLFLLIHGQRLARAGLDQIRDEGRRERLREVLTGAYVRGFGYLGLTIGRVAAAGVFTFFASEVLDVPGAIVLGMVAAVAALVPLIGVLIGSIPVLLLTAAFHPGRLPMAFALFTMWQLGEVLLVQRRLERATVQVGPILSLVALLFGLEAYGVGGMFVAFVTVVLLASLMSELAPSEDSDLLVAADELLPGDDVPAPGK
jgi:predicted PurR-regulated permease PerM